MQIFRHSMATCSINRNTKSQLNIGIFDRYTFTKWQYFAKVYLKLLENIVNTYHTFTPLSLLVM